MKPKKPSEQTYLAHFTHHDGRPAPGYDVLATELKEAVTKAERLAKRHGLVLVDVTGPVECDDDLI